MSTSRNCEIRWRNLQVLLLAIVPIVSVACWPAHPSNDRLIGTWEAVHPAGRETLVLSGDGTYTQVFTRTDGAKVENAGRWERGADSRLSLSGLTITLHDARLFDVEPETGERWNRGLEAVTEWGRTMLVFNPDAEGFVKK
jgi:hypothetical protein